jgi:exoribonuclease-2
MSSSRALKTLGLPAQKETAHSLLLKLSVWNNYVNPYPFRAGCTIEPPTIPIPEPEKIERTDLTHLDAFAVDNHKCSDPDDAVSIENDCLWVHIADPASVVKFNSDIDLEARSRGSNCYMPEKTLLMMPAAVTEKFGLGLRNTSPALSFKISFSEDGTPICSEILKSTVAVKMISYSDAEKLLDTQPFSNFAKIAERNFKRRIGNGACELSFPELEINVDFPDKTMPLEKPLTAEGRNDLPSLIELSQLSALKSRRIIAEMMIIAGEAVGRFMYDKEIRIPYASQPPPEEIFIPDSSLSEQFKYRKTLKKSELHTFPSPHSGLGLEIYTRVTSPLRRYSDLLVHYQIDAYLSGRNVISEDELLAAMSEGEAEAGSANIASRDSYKHWTIAELAKKTGHISEGIVLEVQERRSRVLIPEFALEVMLRGVTNLKEDQKISLELKRVNLPELETNWSLI